MNRSRIWMLITTLAMYGIDVCPINITEGNSVNFSVRRNLFRIFHTTSPSIILDCQSYFSFFNVTVCLKQRKCKFLREFAASENTSLIWTMRADRFNVTNCAFCILCFIVSFHLFFIVCCLELPFHGKIKIIVYNKFQDAYKWNCKWK